MKKQKLEEGQAIQEKCSRCGKKINQIVSIHDKYFFPKCCAPQQIANRHFKERKLKGGNNNE